MDFHQNKLLLFKSLLYLNHINFWYYYYFSVSPLEPDRELPCYWIFMCIVLKTETFPFILYCLCNEKWLDRSGPENCWNGYVSGKNFIFNKTTYLAKIYVVANAPLGPESSIWQCHKWNKYYPLLVQFSHSPFFDPLHLDGRFNGWTNMQD